MTRTPSWVSPVTIISSQVRSFFERVDLLILTYKFRNRSYDDIAAAKVVY